LKNRQKQTQNKFDSGDKSWQLLQKKKDQLFCNSAMDRSEHK